MNSRNFFALVCVSLFLGSLAHAQDAAPADVDAILKPINSLVNADTVLIGHVDLAQLDPAKIAESLKKVAQIAVERLESQPGSDAQAESQASMVDTQMDMFGTMLEGMINQPRELGVTDMYLLVNGKIMLSVLAQVVIVGDPAKFPEVKKAFQYDDDKNPNIHVQTSENLLIVNMVSPLAIKNGEKNVANIERETAQLKTQKGNIRPELRAALDKVKKAPIQAAFSPSPQFIAILGLAQQMAPQLTQGIDLKGIFANIKWASFGFDPMRVIIAVTVQTPNASQAQELYDLMVETQNARNEAQFAAMEESGVPEETITQMRENAEKLQKISIPQVKGDQLVMVINPKYIADYVDVLFPSMALMAPYLSILGNRGGN